MGERAATALRRSYSAARDVGLAWHRGLVQRLAAGIQAFLAWVREPDGHGRAARDGGRRSVGQGPGIDVGMTTVFIDEHAARVVSMIPPVDGWGRRGPGRHQHARDGHEWPR